MNDSSSKSKRLIKSCDKMKTTSERKVKSLNDIPGVIKRNSRTDNESNIRNVSLLSVTSEQYGKSERDAFPLQTIGFKRDNQRDNHFFGTREFVDICSINEEDMEKENGFQKFNIPDINAENQIGSNTKSNPIEAIQVSNTLPEENHLNATEGKELRKVKRILLVIDAFLASVIITPMTVGFWRGIWSLMDIYADIFPGVFTFALGILVHTIFAILKNLLHTRIVDASRKKTRAKKTLCKSMQILYTYVFGAACNMQWRGGWIIFDHFFLDRTWKIITATSVAVITLAIFRSARNLISIPFVVAVDKLTYVFRFTTRYKLNESVANVTRVNASPSDGNVN